MATSGNSSRDYRANTSEEIARNTQVWASENIQEYVNESLSVSRIREGEVALDLLVESTH